MAKKRGSHKFLVGMIVYAVIFLALTAVGLKFFWEFIDAYEQSRPKNTVKAYLEALTVEQMCAGAEPWFSQLDHTIQSEEACIGIIRDSLKEDVTYAKKAGECTDTRQVLVLRSGKQTIGQMTMDAVETDQYGFSRWKVTDAKYDFSYLEGEPVTVTVPQTYAVSVNGCVLDERYITESGIHYPLLEELYDQYELPVMVTYRAAGFLGQQSATVTDPTGAAVTIDADTDMDALLENCTAQEQEALTALVNGFLEKYVQYCGSSTGMVSGNFVALKAYLVPNGALAERLWTASDGLRWAQSNSDKIESIDIHHYVRLADGRYLCDATYLVNTWGRRGLVQTTNRIKLIAVQTDVGLRVEAMTSY